MQLDIDRLIAYFGGVNALAEALKQQDPENAASTAAIYKWRTRGSLPLNQLQKLTALAQAQGRPLDLNAFIHQQAELEKNTMNTNNRVIIFDTTMRDGEQSPGASMTKEEKLRLARQLEKLGVDVIEAGFAAASEGDWEAVHEIAKTVKNSTVCSLCRAVENDIRKAGEALAPAPKRRIHTFIATSPIHMEHKLKMKPKQVVEAAVKAVKIAKEYTDDVEFSAEDAVRSEHDFLVEIFTAVIEAGATTINIPDTVGYSFPLRGMNASAPSSTACLTAVKSSGRATATTIWAWRWPIRWRRFRRAHAKSNAPSTVWANVRAMPAWKKS